MQEEAPRDRIYRLMTICGVQQQQSIERQLNLFVILL
jgi:hypothetical protein